MALGGCIGKNAVGLFLGGAGPTTFDEYGRINPIATPRTPRPGEGRDGEATRRPATRRWSL